MRCLRQDLQPLKVKTERLHELAQAVMCQDGEELCSRLKWPGPHSGREQLLQSLQVGDHQGAGATVVQQGRSRAVQKPGGSLPCEQAAQQSGWGSIAGRSSCCSCCRWVLMNRQGHPWCCRGAVAVNKPGGGLPFAFSN